MRTLKDKLKNLDHDIKKKWEKIEQTEGLSTREKLDKLVRLNIKRRDAREREPAPEPIPPVSPEKMSGAFFCREYHYSLDVAFGKLSLQQWRQVSSKHLALLANDPGFLQVDPQRLLFFDTETTGIAGGTGTIPFMLGFGFFSSDSFQVKIFVLNDLNSEGEMLEAVDRFLADNSFSGVVTYNGRAFDMPLLETRYILQRRRCPLLRLPHLDFLFPARVIWKHTFESRKLGLLAESLLGISRSDDIDASMIPSIYFEFLRTQSVRMLEVVIDHNALDLVGLTAVLLLAARYLQDYSLTMDQGELYGLARIYDRFGELQPAMELLQVLRESASREPLFSLAVKRLAILLKKQKLFREASELWQVMAQRFDHDGFRELSIHYEHREKNLELAVSTVEHALQNLNLSEKEAQAMQKRLIRLRGKMNCLIEEENQLQEDGKK